MSIVNLQSLDAMRALFTAAADKDTALAQWAKSFVMNPNGCSQIYLIVGECDKLEALLPVDLLSPSYLAPLTLWMGPILAWAKTQDFAEHIDTATYFDYFGAVACKMGPSKFGATLNGFVLSNQAIMYASRTWMLTASQHYADEFKLNATDNLLQKLHCLYQHLHEKAGLNKEEQELIFQQTIAYAQLMETYAPAGKTLGSPWWKAVRDNFDKHIVHQIGSDDLELNVKHSHLLLNSGLVNNHKLALLSLMMEDLWLAPELVDKITNTLPSTELGRIDRMPWKRKLTDFQENWLRTYCPVSYPFMTLVMKPEDWNKPAVLKRIISSLHAKADPVLALPSEDFDLVQ